MNMPGFAAKASLYKTSLLYTAAGALGWRGGRVRPQLFRAPWAPGPRNPFGGGGSYNCSSPDAQACITSCKQKNCPAGDLLGYCTAACENACCRSGL
jgi:hypothetical protein